LQRASNVPQVVEPRIPKPESLPASDEIVEVAPGVLRLQLPIQITGLGHVNCYALEDERGFTIVDPGLPGPTPFTALEGRLAQAGIPLPRVHTVVITHSHPDHFGGAARVRRESGADIVTHRSFRMMWDPTEPDGDDPEDATVPMSPFSRPTPWGGEPFRPELTDAGIAEMRQNLTEGMDAPRPTRRLEDAEVVTLGRREWVAMHTPGHTPDHLCLFEPISGAVLSGDHVLPTITPHISGLGEAQDPLLQFFQSLDRMTTLQDVSIVLPAHGPTFTDLNGRVAGIKAHHEERLDRLRKASNEIGRPASVHELMQHLFSERAWGSMAESETFAHLEHLRLAGQAESHWENGMLWFEVA
jgi:glyoxylase-like metal-dependent hydrolase (beta-lactamase superfamily II)